MTDIAFFIQARMGSSRLPKKVLMPFYENQTILSILIQNIRKKFFDIPIIVCTSISEQDDIILEFCNHNNIICYRGDETNVCQRFVDAAHAHNVSTIIRICADNPFLDMDYLEILLETYTQNLAFDYWSFQNANSVPAIKTHFGLFAEIVTLNALERVIEKTSDFLYLEHVTNYIYSHQGFSCFFENMPDYLKDREDIRFTIDDKQDFELMQQIYLYHLNSTSIKKTIEWVDNHSTMLQQMISNIKKYTK